MYSWTYTATVSGAGTHRAVFLADPGKNTIYAIAYFNVGTTAPPPPTDSGPPPKDLGGKPRDSATPGQDTAAPGHDSSPTPAPDGAVHPGQEMEGGCSCSLDKGPLGSQFCGLLLLLVFWGRRARVSATGRARTRTRTRTRDDDHV